MKLKIIEKSIAVGLCLTLIVGFVSFSLRCGQIRQDVLRLHVLANSDSEHDQTIKLFVRDRLLKESETLLCGFDTKSQAEKKIKESIPRLTEAAAQTLAENGCEPKVAVRLEKTYFETRTYENITLPAGEYDALRVEIGAASGKNWWCVMFPQMCVPSAAKRDKPEDKLKSDEVEIITNKQKYKVGFFLVELFESLKNAF